ncbi:YdcF family protein [Deinococcus sp. KNUC1210]|uniref:YdcF family protein n=1 Tax=Deinococcus sp. KNUC1210 TaxID=2917691 RepID=UPI001EF08293|nr:YdcF family protein [Deinococcus sp. KNUC1210]ULH16725.1 YdcF family protein [Deinococcus sp. KNUC1210]
MPTTDRLSRRFQARSGHARGGLGSGALALLLVCLGGLVLALPMLPVRSAAHPQATLLVLGAAQYNGRPSPAFRARLDHALSLYRAGGVRRIVVSGGVGRGDRYSEGEVGQMYLLKRQVPVAVVDAETHSRTTLENLRNSRPLLTGPVTLVTDAVHAPRALALARAVGLKADVSSVPLGAGHWKYRMREKLALLAYTVLGVGD